MTNSSDSSRSDSSQNSQKSRGPFRTRLVLPCATLAVLVAAYFSFFFDGHMRRALEYVGTHIVGAEVDIRRFATSLVHARLEIDGIEVTDKEHPERNIVDIGAVHFQLSWDALLRAKILIDEASILDIQALNPRKHVGYVIPPEPPSDKPSAVAKVEKDILDQTRKKFRGEFLGDVAGLLSGGDPRDQLKNLEGQLKSDAKIKAMQKDLEEKKAKWDQRLKQLPQSKELQVYSDRIKALKFDLNNPAETAKSVQEAGKIIQEASQKVQVIAQAQQDLKSDLNSTSQNYKEIEKLVQEDIRDLQGRLKLPNIDAKEFSEQLFIGLIEKRLGTMAKYVEIARHYMPAKKTPAQLKAEHDKEQAEAIVPPKRGQGHTFRFPTTVGYPLFWLKHAAISSEATAASGDYGGNLKGEIKDLTSDPAFLGRPTLIQVQGDFPKAEIHGFDALITLDHTQEAARETLKMSVAQFPVEKNTLSDSPDVSLALTHATGQSHIEAVFQDDTVTMGLHNTFSDVKYDLSAKNAVVKEIIDNVLKGIPTVDVNADIKGSLSQLDIHVNSNLGDELSKGFQKQLQAKIDQVNAQLKKLVDARIGGNRDKLKGEMDKITSDLTKTVDGRKADADKSIKSTQNQFDSEKNSQGKQLEEQGKKLLKQFGIGG